MTRFLLIIFASFFINFNGNTQQPKSQDKALKKLGKTYSIIEVKNGVVSIQTKKDKFSWRSIIFNNYLQI